MICEALTLNVGSLTSEACYCVVLYDIVIVTNSLKFIHLAVCNYRPIHCASKAGPFFIFFRKHCPILIILSLQKDRNYLPTNT